MIGEQLEIPDLATLPHHSFAVAAPQQGTFH